MIKKSLKIVFGGHVFARGLFLSIFANVVFLYYFILLQTTTWETFWQSNTPLYDWLQVGLSVINALGVALAMVFFFYVWEKKKQPAESFLGTAGSLLFSSAATGCTVCGAFLLPLLGFGASLTVLPFGGLGIKLLSVFLLAAVIFESASSIAGNCRLNKHRLVRLNKKGLEFEFSRKAVSGSRILLVFALFVLAVYLLPKLPSKWYVDFRRHESPAAAVVKTSKKNLKGGIDLNQKEILSEINPADGYKINASYGSLGPKLVAGGAIDLKKFRAVYDRGGKPLTKNQLAILTKGSKETIKIDSRNSYFLLNFFWAVGLANKNKILSQGEITKYGRGKVGSFASTGGWTLGKTKATDFISTLNLISLSAEQQRRVESVSANVYRPCCNNSTAFPDCNHGMAMLGVLELMAHNGASQEEMFRAAKYFNAYWFPQNYYDLAVYFRAKEGISFAQIDPKTLMGKGFSSASGYQLAKRWLGKNNLVKEPAGGGGGCGV